MAQQLFSDIPKTASNIPGMVTPDISADRQQQVNWSDLAAAYALQRRMKEDRAGDWARAAAINNANAAQANAARNQGHYLPGTAETGVSRGSRPQQGGAVLWAPRNMSDAQMGTWADQQIKQASAERRTPPIILQAHTDDPYSPGELGGGVSQNEIGKTLFGSGLTSPLGTANPYALAKGLTNRSVGRTRKGQAPNMFPDESLQQRTRGSSGPQYQYDALYRG